MKKKRKLLKDDLELVALGLPTFLWFVIFSYIPMFGVIIAFKNFTINGNGFIDSLLKSEWVGFNNFKFLFATDDAITITRNTIGYNVIFIILGIIIPVFLAICLNELLNKFMAKFYQTAMLLPYFLSWVVISYFVFAFLSEDKGLLNSIITSLKLQPVSWYSQTDAWPFILVFMNVWKGMGYGTIVYLAAIAGIDRTYYEAALIDGANKIQQIKYITLPLLKPVIIILFILSVGKIFNADFGLFYQVPMNSGILYPVTNVIDTYVYRAMTGLGEIGMSSAAALFQSAVGFVLIMTSNYIVKKIDSENSLL